MTAQPSRKPGQEQNQERPQHTADRRETNLAGCYGAIGIASVAAAARYTRTAKKSADVRSPSQLDERFVEAAA